MNNPNKYKFGEWLIEWDVACATMFLSSGRFSCSLACAEGEGVASDGNDEIDVPAEVIAMAQELEEESLVIPS